jgi:glycosyltransferase involved in cell wall biosynthesis
MNLSSNYVTDASGKKVRSLPRGLRRDARQETTRPRILYVVAADWYFWSHRLPIARAALARGLDVVVAVPAGAYGDRIRGAGFRLETIRLRRGWHGFFEEFRAVVQLVAVYRRLRPDIIHHVALKTVLYGSIAAWITRNRCVVNALPGMGYFFSSRESKARILRPFLRLFLRVTLRRRASKAVVQNLDDLRLIREKCGVRQEQVVLIRGSGVDVTAFHPTPEPPEPVVVTMVSRMLREKGVAEFVDAGRRLRASGRKVRIWLVGAPDPDNPGSIRERELRNWERSGLIEWTGARDDIAQVWARSHIAVLPTYYGEGLPKALLEAAASGRPLVATETPGCRELVRHRESGLLVPPRNPEALAAAIAELVDRPELRSRMGSRAREIVVSELSDEIVAGATMRLYGEMLGNDGLAAPTP